MNILVDVVERYYKDDLARLKEMTPQATVEQLVNENYDHKGLTMIALTEAMNRLSKAIEGYNEQKKEK